MSWRANGTHHVDGLSGSALMNSSTDQRATLSGGERKQLVLDVLFSSDADVLLLDEPDNFLDVPAKLELERRVRESRKTILMISHDRERPRRRDAVDRDARGTRRLGP